MDFKVVLMRAEGKKAIQPAGFLSHEGACDHRGGIGPVAAAGGGEWGGCH